LFDIAHANALNLMTIEEDRAFLLAQREKGRPDSLIGIDKKSYMKEINKEKRVQAEFKRRDRVYEELTAICKYLVKCNNYYIL
jgi:hypothetical protein